MMYNFNILKAYIGCMITVNFNQKTYIGKLCDVGNSTILLKYVKSKNINDTLLYRYSKIDGNVIIDANSIKSIYYLNSYGENIVVYRWIRRKYTA